MIVMTPEAFAVVVMENTGLPVSVAVFRQTYSQVAPLIGHGAEVAGELITKLQASSWSDPAAIRYVNCG